MDALDIFARIIGSPLFVAAAVITAVEASSYPPGRESTLPIYTGISRQFAWGVTCLQPATKPFARPAECSPASRFESCRLGADAAPASPRRGTLQ